MSGISMLECGHCPQVTLEVGKNGNMAILLLSFGEIPGSRRQYSLLGLRGSHHLLWDLRIWETSPLAF